VKQTEEAGRLDVFEAVLMRENRQEGFIISFDFTSDAETEMSRFLKKTGKVIVPLRVREILDEQIAMKLP
jgi:hypothetical protein